MINATLCSTNGAEPWAANVDFQIHGSTWVVGLSAKYAHYKNILGNKNVVIVYKTADFELLAKGVASLSEPNADEMATTTITLTWLRLVENDTVADYAESSEIEHVVNSHT
jgi:hypothetical protein